MRRSTLIAIAVALVAVPSLPRPAAAVDNSALFAAALTASQVGWQQALLDLAMGQYYGVDPSLLTPAVYGGVQPTYYADVPTVIVPGNVGGVDWQTAQLLRNQGLGWGQVAHVMGVPPGQFNQARIAANSPWSNVVYTPALDPRVIALGRYYGRNPYDLADMLASGVSLNDLARALALSARTGLSVHDILGLNQGPQWATVAYPVGLNSPLPVTVVPPGYYSQMRHREEARERRHEDLEDAYGQEGNEGDEHEHERGHGYGHIPSYVPAYIPASLPPGYIRGHEEAAEHEHGNFNRGFEHEHGRGNFNPGFEREHGNGNFNPGFEREHGHGNFNPGFEREHGNGNFNPGFEREHEHGNFNPGVEHEHGHGNFNPGFAHEHGNGNFNPGFGHGNGHGHGGGGDD